MTNRRVWITSWAAYNDGGQFGRIGGLPGGGWFDACSAPATAFGFVEMLAEREGLRFGAVLRDEAAAYHEELYIADIDGDWYDVRVAEFDSLEQVRLIDESLRIVDEFCDEAYRSAVVEYLDWHDVSLSDPGDVECALDCVSVSFYEDWEDYASCLANEGVLFPKLDPDAEVWAYIDWEKLGNDLRIEHYGFSTEMGGDLLIFHD